MLERGQRTTLLTLAVIVPALNRPHLVTKLRDSLHHSTQAEQTDGWQIDAVFVCSPDDHAEIAAVKAAGLQPLIAPCRMDARNQYATKINYGATHTDADWLFLGADDLHFHPGWLTAAIHAHQATGCRVIGTDDRGNATVMAGLHATHSLVHRSYLKLGTIDQRGILLHPGYDHNSSDLEFVETARSRAEFVFCAESVVEHFHRLWGKAPHDAVYAKGMRNANQDRRLLVRRRRLWRGGTVSQGERPKVWP